MTRERISSPHLCTLAAALAVVVALSGRPAMAQSGQAQAASADPRPNIVLIVVDDLGWRDTGAYGSPFHETPNIDRLAATGVRFTQFYAASPVCSPTRASLMTGQHPARVGITDWIGGNDAARLLPPPNADALALGYVTIGEAFRDAGYATGYIGKWHLGAAGFMPAQQGFAFSKAVNGAGQPAAYFFPYKTATPSVWDVPDLEDGKPGEYLTDRLTDEALAFVAANRARPFLLVLAHYAVHTPLETRSDRAEKYAAKSQRLFAGNPSPARTEQFGASTKLRQDNVTYAGMVDSTDESVGRVLDALDVHGLTDRTIVVFVSDNGGLSTLSRANPRTPTSNEPLRAGKGWLYEGGLRVPFLVRAPGATTAGRVVDVPATVPDIYPTLLDLAGVPQRPAATRDGISLGTLLRGGPPPSRPALYWHFPHYHGSGNRPSSAVRAGDWKLIEWLEDGRVELYDLAADPSESHDLAAANVDRVRELSGLLHAWRQSVGAKMPTPNPAWREPR